MLRLYYEVSKRAYRDLSQTYERKMKIQCFKQTCAARTDRQTRIVTPHAPDGAINILYKCHKGLSVTKNLFP